MKMRRILSILFVMFLLIETCLPLHQVKADDTIEIKTEENGEIVSDPPEDENIHPKDIAIGVANIFEDEKPVDINSPSGLVSPKNGGYSFDLPNGLRRYNVTTNISVDYVAEYGFIIYGGGTASYIPSVVSVRFVSNNNDSATFTSDSFYLTTDPYGNYIIIVPWSIIDNLGFTPSMVATYDSAGALKSTTLTIVDSRANIPSDLQVTMSDDGLEFTTDDADYLVALESENLSVIGSTGTVNIYSSADVKELYFTNIGYDISILPNEDDEDTCYIASSTLLNAENMGVLVSGTNYVQLCVAGYKPTGLIPVTVSDSGAAIKTPSSAVLTITNGNAHIQVGGLADTDWLDEINRVEILKNGSIIYSTTTIPTRNGTSIDIPLHNKGLYNGETYAMLAYCGGYAEHNANAYTLVSGCNKAVSQVQAIGIFNTAVSVSYYNHYLIFNCDNELYLAEIEEIQFSRTVGSLEYRQTIPSSEFEYSADGKQIKILHTKVTTPRGNTNFTLVPSVSSGYESVTAQTNYRFGKLPLPVITFTQNSDYDLVLSSNDTPFKQALSGRVTDPGEDYGIILTKVDDPSMHCCFYNTSESTMITSQSGNLVVANNDIREQRMISGEYYITVKVNGYGYRAELGPIYLNEIEYISPAPEDSSISVDTNGNIIINSPTDKNYLEKIYESETACIVLSNGDETYEFVNSNDDSIIWSADEKSLIITPQSQRKRNMVNDDYIITVTNQFYHTQSNLITLTNAYTPLPSASDITITVDNYGLIIKAESENAADYLETVSTVSLRRTKTDGLRMEDISSQNFSYDSGRTRIFISNNQLNALKITNSVHDRIILSSASYLPMDISGSFEFDTDYADMPVMATGRVQGDLRVYSNEAGSSAFFTKINEIEIYTHYDESKYIKFPACDIVIDAENSSLLIPSEFLAEAGYENETIDIRLNVTDSYENWYTGYQFGNAVDLLDGPEELTFAQPGHSIIVFEVGEDDFDWMQSLCTHVMKKTDDDEFECFGVAAYNKDDSIYVVNSYEVANNGTITLASDISCSIEDGTLTVDFSGLPVGDYELCFRSPGYEDFYMSMDGFLANCKIAPSVNIVEGIFGDLEIVARNNDEYSGYVYQMDVYAGEDFIAEIPVSSYNEKGNAVFTSNDLGEAGLESNISYRFILHANGNYVDNKATKTLYNLVKMGGIPSDVRVNQTSSGSIEVISSDEDYIDGILALDDGLRAGISFENAAGDGAYISNTQNALNNIVKVGTNKAVISSDVLKNNGIANGENDIQVYSYGYKSKEATINIRQGCDYAPSGITIEIYNSGFELNYGANGTNSFSGIKITGSSQADGTYLRNVTGISIEKSGEEDMSTYFDSSSLDYDSKSKTLSLSKEEMDNMGMGSEIYDEITLYSYGYIPKTNYGAFNIQTSSQFHPSISYRWDENDNLIIEADETNGISQGYIANATALKFIQNHNEYGIYTTSIDVDLDNLTITVPKEFFTECQMIPTVDFEIILKVSQYTEASVTVNDGEDHIDNTRMIAPTDDLITISQGADSTLIIDGPEDWLMGLTKEFYAKDPTVRTAGLIVNNQIVSNVTVGNGGRCLQGVTRVDYKEGKLCVKLNNEDGDLSISFNALGYEPVEAEFEGYRAELEEAAETEYIFANNRLSIISESSYLADIEELIISDENGRVIVDLVPSTRTVNGQIERYINGDDLDYYDFDPEADYTFTLTAHTYLDSTAVEQIDWFEAMDVPETLGVIQSEENGNFFVCVPYNTTEEEFAYIQEIEYIAFVNNSGEIVAELHDSYISEDGTECIFYSGCLKDQMRTLPKNIWCYAHGYKMAIIPNYSSNQEGKVNDDLALSQKVNYFVGDSLEVVSNCYTIEHYSFVSSNSKVLKVEDDSCVFVKAGNASVQVYTKDTNEYVGSFNVKCSNFSLKLASAKTKAVTGDEFKLNVTNTHAFKDAVITSSDEGIAYYDETTGNVVTTGAGTVTFTAKVNNKSATAKITVYPIDPSRKLVASFSNSRTSIGLQRGNDASLSDTLKISGTLKNKPNEVYAASLFEYSSSDPSVVTVDSEGRMTGVSNGIATITATLKNDPSKRKATIKVQVIDPQTSDFECTFDVVDRYGNGYDEYFTLPENDDNGNLYVTFDYDLEFEDKESDMIRFESTITDYQHNVLNKEVVWTSSDSDIAEVVRGSYVQVKKAGKVTVTATIQDVYKTSYSYTLLINSAAPRLSTDTFELNKAYQGNYTIDYTLTDESITVNSAEFVIENDVNPERLDHCSMLSDIAVDNTKGTLSFSNGILPDDSIGCYYEAILEVAVTVGEEEFERVYKYDMLFNVADEIPNVSVKTESGNISTFTRLGSISMKVTSSSAIASVEVYPEMADYYILQSQSGTYRLCSNPDSPDGNFPKEVVLNVTFGGDYAGEVKQVRVPVSKYLKNDKSSFKYSLLTSSFTINEVLNEDHITFLIKDETGVAIMPDSSEITVKSKKTGETLNCMVLGTVITVQLNEIADDTLIISLNQGWTSDITFNAKVKVDKKVPTAILVNPTVNLNDYCHEATTCISSSKLLTFSKVEIASTGKVVSENLTVSYEAPYDIKVSVKDGTTVAAGTYKYTVTPYLNESTPLKPITLSVKVSNALPTVSVAAMTLNTFCNDSITEEAVIADVDAGYVITNDETLLDNNDVKIEIKDGIITAVTKSMVSKFKTYTYSFVPVIEKDETSITLNKVSGKITLNANQPTVTLNSTKFTLNKQLAGKENIEIRVANVKNNGFDSFYPDSLVVDSITAPKNGDASDLLYSDMGDFISFSLKDSAKPGSYKVTLHPHYEVNDKEYNGKAITLTVTVIDKKESASISIKGKLNVLDRDKQLEAEVKFSNATGETISNVDFGNNNDILEFVGASGSTFYLKLKEDAVIHKDRTLKGQATITTYWGNTLTTNYSVKITRVVPKITIADNTIIVYDKDATGVVMGKVSYNYKSSEGFSFNKSDIVGLDAQSCEAMTVNNLEIVKNSDGTGTISLKLAVANGEAISKGTSTLKYRMSNFAGDTYDKKASIDFTVKVVNKSYQINPYSFVMQELAD